MPAVVLEVDPADIVGPNHPVITRDGNQLIATMVTTTALFVYTVTLTRALTAPFAVSRVDITVADAP